MSKPWKNAIVTAFLVTVVLLFLLNVLFQLLPIYYHFLHVFLLSLLGGILSGFLAYNHTRVSELEDRLGYLEDLVEKLKKRS